MAATCHGGPSNVVARISHRLTAEPSDPVALGAALSRLIGDAELHARCREAAASHETAHSWSHWAARVAALVTRISVPRPQPAPTRIFSDMDNTLTGHRGALRGFAQWRMGGHAFFAVATGRAITEARRILAEWDINEPDAFITSVGTEIYRRDATGRLVFDESWASEIECDWRCEAIRDALDSPSIRMQPEIEQRRWKLGYLGDARQAMRIRNRLDMAGLAARVIASHGRLIEVAPVRGQGRGAGSSRAQLWADPRSLRGGG